MILSINDYAGRIDLFEPFVRPALLTAAEKKRALHDICGFFANEQQRTIPKDYGEQRLLLRALLNIRAPKPIPNDILKTLDRFLWTERMDTGVVEADTLQGGPGKLFLWRGDICTLRVDAIVNAANKKLLGCLQPLHFCIDNAIHSGAGPQLREDCNNIMLLQKTDEETGGAKITRAYNLPSRFIIHTVGPIVQGALREEHKQLLASCYRSCLETAVETKMIQSIAFCCISTGVFGFPAKEAAGIAVETVRQWLASHSGIPGKVIFNVFTEKDYELYRNALSS
jgi:O-acetyl-ADP-ribose deacetylase (regulator of RNase III)